MRGRNGVGVAGVVYELCKHSEINKQSAPKERWQRRPKEGQEDVRKEEGEPWRLSREGRSSGGGYVNTIDFCFGTRKGEMTIASRAFRANAHWLNNKLPRTLL